MAGFIFGVWGMFLIRRGRSSGHLPSALLGVALILYPYFFENPYALWGIGCALLLLAYRLRA